MFPRLYNNQSRSWFVAFVRGSWVRGRPCVFVRGSWFRGSWFVVGGVCSFEVRGMLLDVGTLTLARFSTNQIYSLGFFSSSSFFVYWLVGVVT